MQLNRLSVKVLALGIENCSEHGNQDLKPFGVRVLAFRV